MTLIYKMTRLLPFFREKAECVLLIRNVNRNLSVFLVLVPHVASREHDSAPNTKS